MTVSESGYTGIHVVPPARRLRASRADERTDDRDTTVHSDPASPPFTPWNTPIRAGDTVVGARSSRCHRWRSEGRSPKASPRVRDSGWYRQSGVVEPPQHEYREEPVRLEPLAGRPARSSVVAFPTREHRAGKSALNQLMLSFAARHGDDPRTLLLVAPGWVKTDLGGPSARLNTDESMPRHGRALKAPTETPHL
ncbi:hypothetical protein [Nocardia sp. NPDC060249]|uniref:hypothetical protein n=1 Tax=Nocardia sp. NPDC060249 TaxID=3347082 RepID=UPI00364C63C8